MIYLTLADLLHVAERAIHNQVEVHDYGLLESALARSKTYVFGREVYPSLHAKAAALLHSLARNHALVDGNKRLALGGLIAFYGMNGFRLTLTNDEAYDLIVAVASGALNDVDTLAKTLEHCAEPRP